jgi:SAM-dependent methyltransferase
MKHNLLQWLACPACGGAPFALEVTRSTEVEAWHAHLPSDVEALPGVDPVKRKAEDILDGSLTCPSCGAVYPIAGGIPRLLVEPDQSRPSSAHTWTTFDRAEPVWERNFLQHIAPLGPGDFLGKVVLDAGCGYGRHTWLAARWGAEVVAMDRAPEAVDACRRNTQGLFGVHVIQGDIQRPPLRRSCFDLVYCLGVLHHMERARHGFRQLGGLLVTGGRLSVWMYGPRQGFASAVNRGLRVATTRMEAEQLHGLSRVIAGGLRVFSHTPYRALRPIPVLRDVVTHLPVHDHHKWPFDVVVADVYDRLSIPVTILVTGEELERWFFEERYADIEVSRRVRNNESFLGTGVRR